MSFFTTRKKFFTVSAELLRPRVHAWSGDLESLWVGGLACMFTCLFAVLHRGAQSFTLWASTQAVGGSDVENRSTARCLSYYLEISCQPRQWRRNSWTPAILDIFRFPACCFWSENQWGLLFFFGLCTRMNHAWPTYRNELSFTVSSQGGSSPCHWLEHKVEPKVETLARLGCVTAFAALKPLKEEGEIWKGTQKTPRREEEYARITQRYEMDRSWHTKSTLLARPLCSSR